ERAPPRVRRAGRADPRSPRPDAPRSEPRCEAGGLPRAGHRVHARGPRRDRIRDESGRGGVPARPEQAGRAGGSHRRRRDRVSPSLRAPRERRIGTVSDNGRLAITVAGLSFQNPMVLASGTAGYGTELAGVMNIDRLGGLTTKAVSVEPRAGNAAPRV